MRKLIGTIAIILVLYLGFFGCEKYNVEPFILNWFNSDKSTKAKEKAKKITNIIFEKDKNTEQTDTIAEDTLKQH